MQNRAHPAEPDACNEAIRAHPPSRVLAMKQSARTRPSPVLAMKQSARTRPSRVLAAWHASLHWPAVMADSKRPTLAVEERPERGTRATKRLRREGFVPGVVYGGTDGESMSFKVDARVLRQVLVDGSALIDLKIDGGKVRPVIVKDQQIHPVREQPLHIDLLEVRLDEKIQAPVAVHVQGAEESPGVKEGGVLEQVTHQLNIEALPTDIPDAIVVDMSRMEIAATMHLSEVPLPPGVTFLDDPDETIIATIVVPTEIEEPEEIEEETELVGEEVPEGEEAPAEEGEAPAEGEPAEEGEES
jgi:large subunit ribosomal protein L25